MSNRGIPTTVLLVVGALVVSAGELVYRFVRTIIGEYSEPVPPSAVGIGVIAVVALLSLAVTVLGVLWVWRGLPGAAVFATVLAVWHFGELTTGPDALSWIMALLAIIVIVAIWLPPSREYARRAASVRKRMD